MKTLTSLAEMAIFRGNVTVNQLFNGGVSILDLLARYAVVH